MMFSHFLMAYVIVMLVKERRLFGSIYIFIIVLSFSFSLYLNQHELVRSFFKLFKNPDTEYYNKFAFLRYSVKSDDIILSDPYSNWIIPSYNGKVISSFHPVYWIDDIAERREAVNSFFDTSNSESIRIKVIQKYKPDYILIDFSKSQFTDSTLCWLKRTGKEIYNNNQLNLIKVDEELK